MINVTQSDMARFPSRGSQWTVHRDAGIEGMELQTSSAISPDSLGAHGCLVRIEAVSLNFRDVAIPTGSYPGFIRSQYIPCSDGAGSVVEVGSKVSHFKKGDRVCPTFFQDYVSGSLTPQRQSTSLGGKNDGVLRKHAVFPEHGLIAIPVTLGTLEASTLPCAALTAWNALFGVEGRKLQPGECILSQGTGGVSMFAIQFALAIGATVIATTSTEEKAAKLKTMGVSHVINYKTDATWGQTAKKLSPNGLGVHHVLEVGGNATIGESFEAIRMEGVISIIGFLGGTKKSTSDFWETFTHVCIVRGVNVGSREQFKDMNSFIDHHQIKPIVDKRIFKFEEAKEGKSPHNSHLLFGAKSSGPCLSSFIANAMPDVSVHALTKLQQCSI